MVASHQAVEQEDLPRLKELLDAGHDVEDDAALAGRRDHVGVGQARQPASRIRGRTYMFA